MISSATIESPEKQIGWVAGRVEGIQIAPRAVALKD